MKAIRIQCEVITHVPESMSMALAKDRATALIKLAMEEIGVTSIEMLECLLVEQELDK